MSADAGSATASTPPPTTAPATPELPPDRRVDLRLTRAVWRRNRDVFVRLWTWLLIPNVVDMCLSMIALGIGIGAAVTGFGGTGYAGYIAPGLVVSSALFSSAFECSYGTYFRMDKQRTFDAMVATPVQIEDVVLGELFYGAFRGFASGSVVALIFAAFGLFPSWWALLLVPLTLLTGLMVSALAVSAASLSPMLETLGYWVSFGIFPMYWLSGIFYRPGDFGPVVQQVQPFSPFYHCVELARAASTGSFAAGHLVNLAVVAGVAAAFTWVSITLMRRRLIR